MAKKVAKKTVKSAAKKAPSRKAPKASKSKSSTVARVAAKVSKGGKSSKVATKSASGPARTKAASKSSSAPIKSAARGPVKKAKSKPVQKAGQKQAHKQAQKPARSMAPKNEQAIAAGLQGAEQAPQSGVTLANAKLVTPEKSAAFAVEVARMLRDDKCEDVVCLDVRGRSPVTDYLVIGSGTSDRQMRSVLQHVEDYGTQTGNQCVRRSIDERATWILADFVDVVVHLFEPNTRAHYDLEMLWGDSKRVAWERPDQLSRDYAGLHN